MTSARSLLFVPGDRPDRFEKAVATGAHAVIVDLEDAVQPQGKVGARDAIAGWAGRMQEIVRINGADSPWFHDDLRFIRDMGIAKVMIPKAEPDAIAAAADALGPGVSLIGLIETVAGALRLREVCALPGLRRLAFGNLDFSLDAGLSETDGQLDPLRLQLVLESRFARLEPPIDGVFPAFSDQAGFLADVRRIKALGFGGKLCIHPAQVAPVNAAFLPSAEELAWAERIMAAVAAGGEGAISVDGKMVDRPVVERAKALLQATSGPTDRK